MSERFPTAAEINDYWRRRIDDITAQLEAEQTPEDALEAVKDQVKDWPKEQQQALYLWLHDVLDCRIYGK